MLFDNNTIIYTMLYYTNNIKYIYSRYFVTIFLHYVIKNKHSDIKGVQPSRKCFFVTIFDMKL